MQSYADLPRVLGIGIACGIPGLIGGLVQRRCIPATRGAINYLEFRMMTPQRTPFLVVDVVCSLGWLMLPRFIVLALAT